MVSDFFRPPELTRRIFRPRGTVLLEVVVSSLILVVVIMAIGSFFLGNLRAFGRGKEQMELQRMGTLAMEGMARAIREGSHVESFDVAGTIRAIQIFYPGEPFFDANRSGVCDGGEDFIDINQDGVWNCASGPEANAMPTTYLEFDQSGPDGGTIGKGTDDTDTAPWDILVNDTTGASIWVDNLEFDIPDSGRSVTVAFTIRNDMNTGDLGDDIAMAFSSSVNLRE